MVCSKILEKNSRIELNAIFVYTEAILFGFVEKLQNLEQTEMSNDFLHAFHFKIFRCSLKKATKFS